MSKVFNMVGGGGGVTASIFVNGLSQTDTVTATNGSKTKAGVLTQKPNPAIHGLPDGYTELEYIESTGTQYIDTEVAAVASLRFEADFTPHNDIANPGFGSVFGARSSSYQYILNTYPNTNGGSFHCGAAGTSTQANPELTKDTRCQVSFMGTTFTSAKGGTTKITSVSNVGLSLSLFARNINGKIDEYGKVTLYGMKLYENSKIVRDFIPAKRNSDSVVGLYDIANGVFYENAGTGTFVAGAEVPQTVGVFLISKIKDYGTWTVTATDGTKTATQDVLVDVITEYEIEMSLSV